MCPSNPDGLAAIDLFGFHLAQIFTDNREPSFLYHHLSNVVERLMQWL